MHTLFVSLVAIAALDSLNPTAVALQIYLLTTPKPLPRSIIFIFGVFCASFVCGLPALLGVSRLMTTLFANFSLSLSEMYFYIIQAAIGIVLLVAGLMFNVSTSISSTKRPQNLTVSRTFGLGLAVTIWEFPTALPYLAALEQIARAKLDLLTTIGVLFLYNSIFVLPLVIFVIIYITFQQQSSILLHRINRSISIWAPKILRALLICLGVILIVDSIAYSLGYSFLRSSMGGYPPKRIKPP